MAPLTTWVLLILPTTSRTLCSTSSRKVHQRRESTTSTLPRVCVSLFFLCSIPFPVCVCVCVCLSRILSPSSTDYRTAFSPCSSQRLWPPHLRARGLREAPEGHSRSQVLEEPLPLDCVALLRDLGNCPLRPHARSQVTEAALVRDTLQQQQQQQQGQIGQQHPIRQRSSCRAAEMRGCRGGGGVMAGEGRGLCFGGTHLQCLHPLDGRPGVVEAAVVVALRFVLQVKLVRHAPQLGDRDPAFRPFRHRSAAAGQLKGQEQDRWDASSGSGEGRNRRRRRN